MTRAGDGLRSITDVSRHVRRSPRAIERVIERGIKAGDTPARRVIVGRKGAAVSRKASAGFMEHRSTPVDAQRTIYDVASLSRSSDHDRDHDSLRREKIDSMIPS